MTFGAIDNKNLITLPTMTCNVDKLISIPNILIIWYYWQRCSQLCVESHVRKPMASVLRYFDKAGSKNLRV